MFKKISFFALAILFICGIANATSIPVTVDPYNFPTVWTEEVYNGSGSTIPSGYVVEWDFDTADVTGTIWDDQGMWVKKANGNDDVWTAGVVPFGYDIPASSTGRIIIRGPAVVFRGVAGATLTAGQICASSTSGYVEDESSGGGDTAVLGVVIKATAEAYDVGGDATDDSSLIWVDISLEAN